MLMISVDEAEILIDALEAWTENWSEAERADSSNVFVLLQDLKNFVDEMS